MRPDPERFQLGDDGREVEWPPPREDPPQEPGEPWARERRDGDPEPDWPWFDRRRGRRHGPRS